MRLNQRKASPVPKATGSWRAITIAGHRCQLYEPAHPSEHRQAVLYLHELGEDTFQDRAAFLEQFDLHGFRVMAPKTGPAWWSSRVCPEFDAAQSAESYLRNHIMPWLARHWACEPGQIGLLGPGMGGQGALRMAYKHPDTFPVVAAIGPSIDYQIRIEEGDQILARMYRDAEDARQDTATLHIHPLHWPRHQWFCSDPTDFRWYDSVDRLRMKLFSLGVPFECDLHTGGPNPSPKETLAGASHAKTDCTSPWDYYERMAAPAIGFLAAALEQERLRVKTPKR